MRVLLALLSIAARCDARGGHQIFDLLGPVAPPATVTQICGRVTRWGSADEEKRVPKLNSRPFAFDGEELLPEEPEEEVPSTAATSSFSNSSSCATLGLNIVFPSPAATFFAAAA